MNMKYVSALISLTNYVGSDVHHQRASVLLLWLHIIWCNPARTGPAVLLHSIQSSIEPHHPVSLPGPPPLGPPPDQPSTHLRTPAAGKEAGLRLADPLALRLCLPADPSLLNDVDADRVLHSPSATPGGQAGELGGGIK